MDQQASPKGIIIGIVENDTTFVQSLADQLEPMPEVYQVLFWLSAESAFHSLRTVPLDLMFVDIGLPGMPGSELVPLIAKAQPNTKIIMLTSIRSDDEIMRCLKQGAIGYLLKGEPIDLQDTVRSVLAGGAIMTPSIAARVLQLFRGPEQVDSVTLTKRETQVLEEIINGSSAAEIAKTFATAEGTVRHQIKSIYRKLQVHSRVQLMRRARDLGLM